MALTPVTVWYFTASLQPEARDYGECRRGSGHNPNLRQMFVEVTPDGDLLPESITVARIVRATAGGLWSFADFKTAQAWDPDFRIDVDMEWPGVPDARLDHFTQHILPRWFAVCADRGIQPSFHRTSMVSRTCCTRLHVPTVPTVPTVPRRCATWTAACPTSTSRSRI